MYFFVYIGTYIYININSKKIAYNVDIEDNLTNKRKSICICVNFMVLFEDNIIIYIVRKIFFNFFSSVIYIYIYNLRLITMS